MDWFHPISGNYCHLSTLIPLGKCVASETDRAHCYPVPRKLRWGCRVSSER